MKIIYYKSPYENEQGDVSIIDTQYETYNEEDFAKWLDIIEKTYSKYGEVTWKEFEDPKTDDEIRDEKIEDVDSRLKELETVPPITTKIVENEEVLNDLLINVIPNLQGGV